MGSWEIIVSTIVPTAILAASYIFQLFYKQKNNKSINNENIEHQENITSKDSESLDFLVDFVKSSELALTKQKEVNLREQIQKEFTLKVNQLEELINYQKSKLSLLEEERRKLSGEKDYLSRLIHNYEENKKNYSLFINFYDSCRSWGLGDIETLKDFISYWRDNQDIIELVKLNASKNKKDGPMSGKMLEKEWENIFKNMFSIWIPNFVELSRQPKNQLGQRADFLIYFSGSKGHINENFGLLKILIELKTSNIKKTFNNSIDHMRELEKQVTKLLEETRYTQERFDIALFIVGERMKHQILGSQESIWIGLGRNENPYLESWRIEGDPVLVFTSYEYSHNFLKNLFHSWWLFSEVVSHKLFANSRGLRQFEERIPNINRQTLSLLFKVNKSRETYYNKLQQIIGLLWKFSEEWRQWIVKEGLEDENLNIIKNQVWQAIDWIEASSIKHAKSCRCKVCEEERWNSKYSPRELVVWRESNNQLVKWSFIKKDEFF